MRRAWERWGSDLPARVALWLVTAAFGLLFLEAAGTFEVAYTVTPSYALLAAACVLGAPLAVDGWLSFPRPLLLTGAALLAYYVLCGLFAPEEVVTSIERASGTRDIAYVGDLALGLGVVGLVHGLVRRFGAADRLALALVGGALAVAAYALYQWPAQEFGWPVENLNNAVNTSGISRGDVSQGDALLGWERVRGTFAEPQYLATFLAALLPIVVCMLLMRAQRRWMAPVGGALMVLAMVLTVSVPPWAAAGIGSLLAAFVVAYGRRAVGPAALASAGTALALVASAVALAAPSLLADLTGRPAGDLERTAEFRLGEWSDAGRSWAERPLVGHGPGQSSVQLAEISGKAATLDLPEDTVVLGSAHGLWAAALVDGGLLGFALWAVFLGAVALLAAQALAARGGAFGFAVFAAGMTALLASLIVGDRLEIRTWVLLGLMLAVLLGAPPRQDAPADTGQRNG